MINPVRIFSYWCFGLAQSGAECILQTEQGGLHGQDGLMKVENLNLVIWSGLSQHYTSTAYLTSAMQQRAELIYHGLCCAKETRA